VARIGGDEFVVLLPVVASTQDALAVADKIREALAHPFDLGDVRGEVSASIGVAMYPGHGHTPVELLRHADEAMYASKQAGSNRVTLYSEPESFSIAGTSTVSIDLRDHRVGAWPNGAAGARD
jgi:diguanylate cyclase (GGDEF)-like protein